jgi:hypothetical protein
MLTLCNAMLMIDGHARYDAPFPFGFRHADGSPMSTAQVVRRLSKMEIPLFMMPARIMTLGATGTRAAWVGGDAWVWGDAWVGGDACVYVCVWGG